MLRGAEQVDQVDGLGNVDKGGVSHPAEQKLARQSGIDGNHPVAALQKILEDEIAGAAGIG